MDMQQVNNELKELHLEQRRLIIDYEKHEVSEEIYIKTKKDLEDSIREHTKLKIALMEEQQKKHDKTREEQQEDLDEQVKNIRNLSGAKLGRPFEKKSYRTLIVTELKKDNQNLDKVLNTINELKPGRDKTKTKTQIKRVIYDFKKNIAPESKSFIWNRKKFKLVRHNE
ncbi:hypothetical protein CMI37_29850 [Candidatus Pacearchaeota archaeon]|nr:hypothetical protein [Candidatus Pacearchaeota archaeon]